MVWQGFAANPMASMKDARAGLIPTFAGVFGKMPAGTSRGRFFGSGLKRSAKAGWEMSFKGAMIFIEFLAAQTLRSRWVSGLLVPVRSICV
jgi:hypothetical protein